jgi:hypothetical protein
VVEQPGGRSRTRGFPDGGDFPGHPSEPVPAGTPVSGTVKFKGGLAAETVALTVSLSGGPSGEQPRDIKIGNIQLTP